MVTILTLLSCVLVVGQPGERPRAEWQIAPRLNRGQELVYRGTVREQSLSRGVQFNKTYRLEVRALVLDAKRDGVSLGFLTRLSQEQTASRDRPNSGDANVRLLVGEVDALGRLITQGETRAELPLDGPATGETGFLVELPRGTLRADQTWVVAEPNRPPRTCRIVGSEIIGGAACIKISAQQQSEDWEQPRADMAAWRRSDTVWINTNLGIAQRVHREIERRDPAHREPSHKLVTQYELESNLPYTGLFLEDRKRDIVHARQFEEAVQALLPQQPKHGSAPFEAIIARIDQYADKYPATPYREGVLRARALAVAAKEGRLTSPVPEQPRRDRLIIGKLAPEFVVESPRGHETVTLRKWRGKTVLMVFFRPGSETTQVILYYVKRLADQYSDQELAVVGFFMGEDTNSMKRLDEQAGLPFLTLPGKSLRHSYDVEATPRFVIIDAEGIVRGAYTGWGPEIPSALQADLRKCVHRPETDQAPPP